MKKYIGNFSKLNHKAIKDMEVITGFCDLCIPHQKNYTELKETLQELCNCKITFSLNNQNLQLLFASYIHFSRIQKYCC
jgi:hypothetical protein